MMLLHFHFFFIKHMQHEHTRLPFDWRARFRIYDYIKIQCRLILVCNFVFFFSLNFSTWKNVDLLREMNIFCSENIRRTWKKKKKQLHLHLYRFNYTNYPLFTRIKTLCTGAKNIQNTMTYSTFFSHTFKWSQCQWIWYMVYWNVCV